MLFTCTEANCADPRHAHPRLAALRKPAVAAKRSIRGKAAAKLAGRRKGKSLRIDIHCHYLNPEVQSKTASLNPAQHDPAWIYANDLTRETNLRQVKDRGPKLSSIDVRLKDMDRMGIDIQAVSPAPNQLAYWAEPGLGLEISRLVNDRLAEIAASHPDRFVALGTVPLQNVELALAELERCVKQLGMRGIEISPNVNGRDLTDAQLGLERFFAKVQELGILIFMHPLGFTQGERLRDHYFNNVIGNPLETTVAASHLVFDGVMDRYPRLKIVLPHAGGYLAHYWARMDHAHRARPDCHTVIRKAPSSYLAKFYFDTITFDRDMLRHLIDKWGVDHVLLGTDYPYDMGEVDPVGLIDAVKRLTRTEKERIMGGNAARLLGIKS